MKTQSLLGMAVIALALGGCASAPPTKQASTAPKSGGYYLDDGPETHPPANLDAVPDAVPRKEPLLPSANRTYVALGTTYTPQTTRQSYSEEGLASWYGRRFQGKKTASGEPYDMYAMTAAHPTLPIPSYARVTSLATGKSVVVRINDRGPFHSKRIIDLSYTAAHKLGFLKHGSTRVRVERIDPDTYDTQGKALPDGVYLQVGAFSRADNAQQLLDRLKRQLDLDVSQTRIVLNDGLHRVQLGPYANDDAAQSDRARVRERLDLNAVLVRRD
ncbi:MAG: septal ring lytic transglycosylase RlpA family protein [Betaproteobacteria bacterium]